MADLIYFPQRGYGVLPVDDCPYDEIYFKHFEQVSDTRQGRELNRRRVEFVERFRDGQILCDVGVGTGAFLSQCSKPWVGYDIAEVPCSWLRKRGAFFDISEKPIGVATLWDSIEHMDIAEATKVLGNVMGLCFLSTPIYESADAMPHSKHFKPGEHILYFTDRGLLTFMRARGWRLIARSNLEVECGREGIGTFAFERC